MSTPHIRYVQCQVLCFRKADFSCFPLVHIPDVPPSVVFHGSTSPLHSGLSCHPPADTVVYIFRCASMLHRRLIRTTHDETSTHLVLVNVVM